MTEHPECEYSKPYFDGSIHYRKCLLAPGGCSESGWLHHYQECLIRELGLKKEVPLPKPEEKVPEPMDWEPIFKRYQKGTQ